MIHSWISSLESCARVLSLSFYSKHILFLWNQSKKKKESTMKYSIAAMFLMAGSLKRPTSAFVPSPFPGNTGGSAGAHLFLFDKLFSTSTNSQYPVYADESVMKPKAHGTSEKPVQSKLRWNCDFDTADRSKDLQWNWVCSLRSVDQCLTLVI